MDSKGMSTRKTQLNDQRCSCRSCANSGAVKKVLKRAGWIPCRACRLVASDVMRCAAWQRGG
eukprot:1155687-Pleurochrysis_carterae.AAC.1